MAGFQVAPLLRSRRRPPIGRSESSNGGASWCFKVSILVILAILALLTSFQNMRTFPSLSHSVSSKGESRILSGKIDRVEESVASKAHSATEASIEESKLSKRKESKPSEELTVSKQDISSSSDQETGDTACRGIENWELWGPATVAGDKNKQATPERCCESCKAKCKTASSCRCDSWVYCGEKEACGEHFQECWLKKQEDELKPDVRLGQKTPWTSGMIYAAGKGVVSLETSHGNIRIQLAPDLAPRTVEYVRSVLALRFCSGCQFYRAEGLGEGWTKDGGRTEDPPGPPYALLQGSLQADGLPFVEVPKESAPIAKRGAVCLIGGGPEFFISTGDHVEWGSAHTVFGHVLPEDMKVVDALVDLPTRNDVWGETQVQVLETPVQFALKRAVPVT